jgi:biotin carboxyl carrier protein
MTERTLRVGDATVACDASREGDTWTVRVDARSYRFRCTRLEPGIALVECHDRARLVHFATAGGRVYLHLDGVTIEVDTARADEGAPAPSSLSGDLRAPMHGLVVKIHVQVGETVRTGQPIMALEAMKMEHVVRAPFPGVVQAVCAEVGDAVEGNAVVARLEPPPHGEAS